MSPNLERLRHWNSGPIHQAYGPTGAILYALSIGVGSDPLEPRQLRFVWEENHTVFPTYPVVLGAPPPFYVDPAVGLTPGQILHAEQGLVLHRALPSTATVTGVTRVTGLADKGHGRGALIYLERGVADSRTGERYATVTSTYYIRGGGGFGGQNEPAPPPHRLPDRLPDLQFDMPTMAQMALFYRLNGDLNPLHVDAAVAAEAGYPRPILHGLCTYAIAAHAVLRAVADDAPAAMQALQARFSAPVFPGETLAIRIWRDGAIVSFEASVKDRDVVVLTNGRAVMRRDS